MEKIPIKNDNTGTKPIFRLLNWSKSFQGVNKCHDWWKKLFDQPVKNDQRTYDNIQKIMTEQGDDYATVCLLDYLYFKKVIK